ncbi:polyribonucleotide nucleotidyltransferase [Patescibacteria group bacterium]
MNKKIYKEIDFADKKLSLETGKLATLTNMAIKATFGDTVLLVTVASGGLNKEIDYFPLSINYREKFYASGSVKSSRFMKRDGRATDDAIIAGRAIDHVVRPLFPEGYKNEVQVIISVLSLDPEADPKFLGMVATSAALHASTVPWSGPIVSARVGYVDGDYVLCPNRETLHEQSDLDMMVSFIGDDKKFMGVEAEANILSEEKILGGIEFARSNLDSVLGLIKDFAKEANPKGEKQEYEAQIIDPEMLQKVSKIAEKEVEKLMLSGKDKNVLNPQFISLTDKVIEELGEEYEEKKLKNALHEVEKTVLQRIILDKGIRPDGRGITEVREVTAEVSLLPRTHGSGLFNRGVTQVLTTATLASPSEELLLQDMYGERSKRYLHYYNFPPFSVGEVGRVGFPKNREIGHGMIAENALRPVIPDQKDFPYMILLVSETLGSSGSSSMAATCGSSLALMDAGVPIKDIVGGVGVGLIATEDFKKTMIMTDLAYMEDAYGLLDFKMTGTKEGVTAIQCDMKVAGLPMDLLPKIVEQSKEGRLHVLSKMAETISQPRGEVSKFAPKTTSLHIDPDKIGMVIGSGGKVIKEIQEKNEVVVSIDDDGTVVVSGEVVENVEKAAEIIENMTKDVKPGEIYDGVVEEIVDFGAFVEILPGKTGLLHISEVSNEFVDNLDSIMKAGDVVKVKVLEADPRNGKISLSKKALEPKPQRGTNSGRPTRDNDRRPSSSNRGGRRPRR